MVRATCRRRQAGLTLTEVLLSVAVGALLLAALDGVTGQALRSDADARERRVLQTEARFAMQRLTSAVLGADRLLVPLADRPATAFNEALRSPGVLVVGLDPGIDRDLDGFADADNDKDGRIDEDPPADQTFDGRAGVGGIDDDGDGTADEGVVEDNDEDGAVGEDSENGVDDDGDGSVDEDAAADRNKDGAPGVLGVDDDGDGSIDEGAAADDDEDGRNNEDWLDVVVYRLAGTDLLERMPDVGAVDGNDWTERVVAAGVTEFRVERVAPAAEGLPVLVDLRLTLVAAGGRSVSVQTRVRLGGAR